MKMKQKGNTSKGEIWHYHKLSLGILIHRYDKREPLAQVAYIYILFIF